MGLVMWSWLTVPSFVVLSTVSDLPSLCTAMESNSNCTVTLSFSCGWHFDSISEILESFVFPFVLSVAIHFGKNQDMTPSDLFKHYSYWRSLAVICLPLPDALCSIRPGWIAPSPFKSIRGILTHTLKINISINLEIYS